MKKSIVSSTRLVNNINRQTNNRNPDWGLPRDSKNNFVINFYKYRKQSRLDSVPLTCCFELIVQS